MSRHKPAFGVSHPGRESPGFSLSRRQAGASSCKLLLDFFPSNLWYTIYYHRDLHTGRCDPKAVSDSRREWAEHSLAPGRLELSGSAFQSGQMLTGLAPFHGRLICVQARRLASCRARRVSPEEHNSGAVAVPSHLFLPTMKFTIARSSRSLGNLQALN